jgi:hypothetical protein
MGLLEYTPFALKEIALEAVAQMYTFACPAESVSAEYFAPHDPILYPLGRTAEIVTPAFTTRGEKDRNCGSSDCVSRSRSTETIEPELAIIDVTFEAIVGSNFSFTVVSGPSTFTF